jgi:hypothetical protein
VAGSGNSLKDFFGRQPRLSYIASEPFTEKVIQRSILGIGPTAGTFDKGFVRTESDVSHNFQCTLNVHTRRSYCRPPGSDLEQLLGFATVERFTSREIALSRPGT